MCKMSKVATLSGFKEFYVIFMKLWQNARYISIDGIAEGVTALYPVTTLTTDTQGIIIDCEYNRDINKAYEEITNAIISLGGNV